MIFWRGLGFFVFIFLLIFCVASAIVVANIYGSDYVDHHSWAWAPGIFLTAVVCWFLGKVLAKRDDIDLDNQTPLKKLEILSSYSRHTFGFMPIYFWGPILAVAGLVVIMLDYFKN